MGDSVFLQKSVNGDSGTCLGVHLLDGSGVAAAACDARRAAVGENSKRCELVVPEGPASQASPSPSPLRSPSMCASPTPLRTLCPPLWREGCVHVVSRHDLSSARGGIWRENRTHPHREGERGPSLFPSKTHPWGGGRSSTSSVPEPADERTEARSNWRSDTGTCRGPRKGHGQGTHSSSSLEAVSPGTIPSVRRRKRGDERFTTSTRSPKRPQQDSYPTLRRGLAVNGAW